MKNESTVLSGTATAMKIKAKIRVLKGKKQTAMEESHIK